MNYLEYTKKLERIRFLAERKMTGTPEALADKLEVSESTLKRMVRMLKDMGVPIEYCRNRNSYII